MIVRVQVKLPADGLWELTLPDYNPQAADDTNKPLEDWVWKHGKDQLLSKLAFFTTTGNDHQSHGEETREEEKQDTIHQRRTSVNSISQNSLLNMNHQRRRNQEASSSSSCQIPTNSNPTTQPQQPHFCQQRLHLLEKLQTVQQDFLDRVQEEDIGEEQNPNNNHQEETKTAETVTPAIPSPHNNSANVALRELLDSVLEWSGNDYGFIAPVQHRRVVSEPKKGETMNDVSELDHSDMDDRNDKRWRIGPKLASVNVPFYNPEDDEDNEKDFFSDSDVDLDDDSSVEAAPSTPQVPQRPPQPITTYGPVHYKSIPGSLTLMMDQLRFEPVNPLDMLHEGSDEDNSDQNHDDDDAATASHEYNYMQVHWDKVEKYQLTPKSSTRNHLFKLVFRKNNPAPSKGNAVATAVMQEVILKMKNRAELERIADDVKTRVVLPSRKKQDKTSTTIPTNHKRRRRKKRRYKNPDSNLQNSTTSPMTQRERSVMMPPSLPRRMTSDRNLVMKSSSGPQGELQNMRLIQDSNSNDSADSPAPRRPMRRPTNDEPMKDLSFVDDDSDYYDSDDESSEDDDDGDTELWAIQDLLAKCRHLKRPLTYKTRKRDRRPLSLPEEPINNNQNDNKTATIQPLALLPERWQRLVVIPVFESKQQLHLQSIFVIAATEKPTQLAPSTTLDLGSKEWLDWWIPTVVNVVQDLWQHKVQLERLCKSSKALLDLKGQLRESLSKHSDMIHGILPPMAVSKLKVQPQQWKSPLQQFHQQLPPKPSVVPMSSAALSVDDSSISGSVHSRYGLLVGGVPSLDSSSTIQTVIQGGASADSEYGLPRVSENNAQKALKLPERSASTKTAQQQSTQQQSFGRPVPQRTNSVGNINAAIRGLQRQGSVTNRAGTTRPVFSRMDSKRGMLMMRGSSARGGALMRMDSAKRGNLMKMDSARFGRGIPRLNSLRSLHGGGGMSVATSNASVDTFDQSWRTMYTDEDSLHPEDFSQNATQRISVLSQDVSYLTGESSVRYINSAFVGGIKDVQALYAEKKANVSIVVISIVRFYEMEAKLKVGPAMDMLAKLLFTVDRLCEKHRTIKVATIGNTILVMSGLFTTESDEDNNSKKRSNEDRVRQDKKAAIAALELAKEVVSEAQTIEIPKDPDEEAGSSAARKKAPLETMRIRVGIHAGTVKYGVLGQNVPQLNCFGDALALAMRMEETAPDNCIRVSRGFRDLVGEAELEWDQEVEMVDISSSPVRGGAQAANSAMLSSTSQSFERSSTPSLSIETFTLEPPPPAISGGNCASVTSFPSLAPFGSSDFLQISDHGGMLSAHLEQSLVSGEFDVD